MEREMANDNTANDIDRVWDLTKTIGFAMLVTHDGAELRARPMSAVTDTRPDLGDNRKVAL
jgi:hypothetical protein